MGELSISFDKKVVIRNTRLVYLYWFLLSCFITALSVRFVYSRHYQGRVSIGNELDVSMWSIGGSEESLAELESKYASASICTAPRLYDYWWDGRYKYETGSCVWTRHGACERNVANCTAASQLLLREARDQLLFITRREMTFWTKDKGEHSRLAYFLPQVEALGIGLSFAFAAKLPAFDWPFVFGQPFQTQQGSSRSNVLSVMLDNKGEIYKLLGVGSTINIMLPELLELTGKSDFLDVPDVTKVANVKPNASFDHPIGRVSGGLVTIHLDCRGSPLQVDGYENIDYGVLLEQWAREHYDAICLLSFVMGFDRWAYNEQNFEGSDGVLVSSVELGIRVVCNRKGSFAHWDANNIWLNLTSALVFLAMCKHLVLFISVRCLGLLSTIYRKAVFDVFDIGNEVSGLATRLMSASMSFRQLVDDENKLGMTEDHHRGALKALLKSNHALDSKREVETFARFCWAATAFRKDDATVSSLFDGLCPFSREGDDSSATHTANMVKGKGTMTIDKFNTAMSSGERVEFADVVKLFDDDAIDAEKKFHEELCSQLESLFMPRTLITARQAARTYVSMHRASMFDSNAIHSQQDLEEPRGGWLYNSEAQSTPSRGCSLADADEDDDPPEERLAQVVVEWKEFSDRITERLADLERRTTDEMQDRLRKLDVRLQQLEIDTRKRLRRADERVVQVERQMFRCGESSIYDSPRSMLTLRSDDRGLRLESELSPMGRRSSNGLSSSCESTPRSPRYYERLKREPVPESEGVVELMRAVPVSKVKLPVCSGSKEFADEEVPERGIQQQGLQSQSAFDKLLARMNTLDQLTKELSDKIMRLETCSDGVLARVSTLETSMTTMSTEFGADSEWKVSVSKQLKADKEWRHIFATEMQMRMVSLETCYNEDLDRGERARQAQEHVQKVDCLLYYVGRLLGHVQPTMEEVPEGSQWSQCMGFPGDVERGQHSGVGVGCNDAETVAPAPVGGGWFQLPARPYREICGGGPPWSTCHEDRGASPTEH